MNGHIPTGAHVVAGGKRATIGRYAHLSTCGEVQDADGRHRYGVIGVFLATASAGQQVEVQYFNPHAYVLVGRTGATCGRMGKMSKTGMVDAGRRYRGELVCLFIETGVAGDIVRAQVWCGIRRPKPIKRRPVVDTVAIWASAMQQARQARVKAATAANAPEEET